MSLGDDEITIPSLRLELSALNVASLQIRHDYHPLTNIEHLHH